jgi:CheY-like chemotaxis protein
MKKNIMLVDDLELYLEIERDYLNGSLVNVITAKNGNEAMELLLKCKPDLIFMDLEMPKMDGALCCQFIKSNSTTASIPVVMVTSSGNEEKCRQAGCDHFMPKPLDRDVFLGVARKYIPEIDRREKRTPVQIPCRLEINSESIPCRLSDLSIGGAFVVTDRLIEAGTVAKIFFSLPNGCDIACSGRVAWTQKSSVFDLRGVGIKFALMPNSSKIKLTESLESLGNDTVSSRFRSPVAARQTRLNI